MKIYGTVDIKGKFWPQRTSSILEVQWTTNDEGRILYDDDNDNLYYGTNTGWKQLLAADDFFSEGTKLIFASVLPTDWNIDSEIDDKVVILTGTPNKIGNIGGSWTISGMNYSGGHVHFTPLSLGLPSVNIKRGKSELYASAAYKNHKHQFASEGSHIHLFQNTWRPAHVKYIIGVFQG